MRYFRATDEVYESVRARLDAAYGYPNAETKTLTAIPPAAELPHSDGLAYLAMQDAYCQFVLPAEMITELVASGSVEEITAEEYAANVESHEIPQEPRV